MLKWTVFLMGVIFQLGLMAQTDSIRLVKEELKIYQCQNEGAENWFIFTENQHDFTLIQLDIPQEELKSWYKRRSDSQNFYRSAVLLSESGKYLHFQRNNELKDSIRFEIINIQSTKLELLMRAYDERYYFHVLEL